MKFHQGDLYHIYNRGNNQQPIFYSIENYLFFIKKMRNHILSEARLLAYCLMPNHFHWLVHIRKQCIPKPPLSLNNNIGTILRSYTQAINKRYGRSGSLFQQKTKAIHVDSHGYALTCFHYIHQNPIRAKLVNEMVEWPFSSFPDYANVRNGTLVDKKFTYEYLDINPNTFIEESKQALDPQKIQYIY